MKRMLLLTAALAIAPLAAAHAGLIPTDIGTSAAGAGAFTWNYNVELPTTLTAFSGVPSASPGMNGAAYVTIYDFAGFIPGTCVSPVGWGCSTQNTGLTPVGTMPQDNPNVTNITWSYLSGTPIFGDLVINGFSAMSTSNVAGTTSFTGTATRSSGAAAGTNVADIGTTMAPTGGTTGGTEDQPTPPSNPGNGGTPGTGLPEPGALGLMGAALIVFGMLRRHAGGLAKGWQNAAS